MAAFKPYRIIELPEGGDKGKSQFIDQADLGLAISELSHNLNVVTARFPRLRQKALCCCRHAT
jgi:hypothetical protein